VTTYTTHRTPDNQKAEQEIILSKKRAELKKIAAIFILNVLEDHIQKKPDFL